MNFAEFTVREAEASRVQDSEPSRALEHAGYLATAAENYLKVRNEYDEKSATDGCETADIDLLSDHFRALNAAIYEFRKRAAKVGDSEPGKES